MTELRFHRALYSGPALDEAAKVYEPYGTLDREEAPEHWVVRISAASPARERQLAGELGNYALGLVVRGQSKS